MNLPAWADQKLSSDLKELCSLGEGATQEFKREFPDISDLGKSIAAFATSGPGRIFIGLANDGSIVGIKPDDSEARDKAILRIKGLIASIQPAVNLSILFAVDTGRTVLCVDIPKQTEPLYFHNNRPIVRDGPSSRPATPDEVKKAVWAHPSSEYRRRAEELNLQWMQKMQDDSDRNSENAHELRRLSTQRLFGR